jgi:hypothetical protein
MAFNDLLEHMRYYDFPTEDVRAILRKLIDCPFREKLGERGYQLFLVENDRIEDKDYDKGYECRESDSDTFDKVFEVMRKLAPYYVPGLDSSSAYEASTDPVRYIIEHKWDEIHQELHR